MIFIISIIIQHTFGMSSSSSANSIRKTAIEYKSYHTDLNGLNKMLDEFGVAEVSVLDEKECGALREQAWAEIQQLTCDRIKISEPETWANLSEFYPLHSMLIQYFGVGHMKWVWDLRQHPAVKKVFEIIHKDDDLLVSFDGISIHMPHETTRKGYYRGNDWLHTDQSPLKNEHCVQGLVNLYPVNVGDASLVVYEGSHKFHAEFFKHFGNETKTDWYRLTCEEEIRFFEERGCKKRALTGKEGSMFLWNSKTFHQGVESDKNREKPNHRLVSYICMTPRKWATPAALKKKRAAFESGRVTSHWPHRVKLFPKSPRTYGGDLPTTTLPEKPKLTIEGIKLAGF
jgi:hypothetical protein